MKRTVIYAATAVLLGLAVMTLPLAIETGPPTYQPRIEPHLLTESSRRDFLKETYGLTAQPANLLPSSLVLFSGLIVALGIYIVSRRRIP